MNKRSINWVAFLLSIILMFTQTVPSLAANVTSGSNGSAKKSVISISADANTICVGEKCTLKLKNSNSWKIKKASSSNTKVAKVTKISTSKKAASVKGLKEGKARITFKLSSSKKKLKTVTYSLTVRRLVSSKSSISVNEAGTLSLAVPDWKITKAISANDNIASVAKVFKTHIKFVGKKEGKTTFKITATNGKKAKTVTVSIAVTNVVQSEEQPTQPSDPTIPTDSIDIDDSVFQITVGTQQEMQDALKRFPNLAELTIHTDLAETFTLDGNYPNLRVIVDAPNAEFYNSASVKEVDIYAISCDTWYEKGVNNVINLFCECHVIIDEVAINTTINIGKENCNSKVESNSSTVINITAKGVFNIGGKSNMNTVNVSAKDVTLLVNSLTRINLEIKATLVVENNTTDVLNIKTPFGMVSVFKETKRTITESINSSGSSSSSSSSSNSGGHNSNVEQNKPAPKPDESDKPAPKPDESDKPTSKPDESDKPPVQPEEPVVPECQHKWTEWSNAGKNGETRECLLCKKQETRQHDIEETVSYVQIVGPEDKEETQVEASEIAEEIYKHEKTVSQQCKNCDYNNTSTSEEICLVEWKYSSETGLDVSICPCGSEKTRQHIHSDEPTDLDYEFLSSNSDGTHKLQAKYTCEFCLQEMPVIKTEDCVFGEVTIQKNPQTQWNFNHHHLLSKTCTKCGYNVEEEEYCVIDEDIANYYMYVNNHLALVRYCSICKNDMYFLHDKHTLGEWSPLNDQEHRRECECTTFREDEDHTFGDCYDNDLGGFQCNKCGYLKVVEPHDHGYGLAGKHGDKNIMMDIVLNKDAYAECINMSPIDNPDPTSGEYCSRFDFRCQTCGAKYSCYIDHDIQNGPCKCGYTPPSLFSLIANSTAPEADEIEGETVAVADEQPNTANIFKPEFVQKPEDSENIVEISTGSAIKIENSENIVEISTGSAIKIEAA